MDTQPENKKIKNLFVVDWGNTPNRDIDHLLHTANLPAYDWSVYNCFEKKYGGIGLVNRYIAYFSAVIYIVKNKNKYDNIIIWQQMIGIILCLLPKFYSRPKIIITTLLYSPGRVKAGSFRLFLLKRALKKADALLYFSEDMAQDVRAHYPALAAKVFSTYLPITKNMEKGTEGVELRNGVVKKNSVFTGGISDRDFETVIRAFTNTDVPVTIACAKNHVFKNPNLITPNFTIVRDIGGKDYYSLVLSCNFVVIALENEYSSCGQLLFTFSMKHRLPIIATDCFGTRDYIQNNENGILVAVKDDRAIFAAYNKLVNDVSFREKLVERSVELSAKMTFENYLYKIDSIIQQ